MLDRITEGPHLVEPGDQPLVGSPLDRSEHYIAGRVDRPVQAGAEQLRVPGPFQVQHPGDPRDPRDQRHQRNDRVRERPVHRPVHGVQTQRVADRLSPDRLPNAAAAADSASMSADRRRTNRSGTCSYRPSGPSSRPPVDESGSVWVGRTVSATRRNACNACNATPPTQRSRMHNQTVRIPGLLPPQRQQQLLHLPESAGELPVQILNRPGVSGDSHG